MAATSIALTVQPEFGYVLLVVLFTGILNIWQIKQVATMRRRLSIFYPTMYSDKHPDFNCYQRVHQNTLELIPFFLSSLLLSSLRHPLVAAVAGAVWLIGRVIYSLGYYTGNPKKRMPGFITTIAAQLVLFGTLASSAAMFVGWW